MLMIKLNVMLLWANEVKPSDVVITCTIVVCDRLDALLFNPGSTYSYVSVIFAFEFEMSGDVLDALIRVSTLVRESTVVIYVYRARPILYMEF